MPEDLQDLCKAISKLHHSLDDTQINLILDFLMEYAVSATDKGAPNAAKIISGIGEVIQNTRKWKWNLS